MHDDAWRVGERLAGHRWTPRPAWTC